MPADIETLSIDTIRCLAMDAVQKANAGHPGTAMALAPVAYVLYRERMRHDPADPALAEPRPLRALGGPRLHPPVRRAAPLRLRPHDGRPQAVPPVGVAHAGAPRARARASAHARRRDQRPGRSGRASATPSAWRSPRRCSPSATTATASALVDHRTYAICSDGDVMEGVSGEASSLAGFLGLGKLCLIYDDNHITIEGSTGLAFGEDVGLRYEAYGFHVQRLDGRLDDRRPARRARRRRRRDRAPVADHRAHAHRDRRPARARHAGGARRAARRGGGAAHQAGLRLGSGPHVLRARRGLRALLPARARRRRPRRLGRAARRAAGSGSGAHRRVRPRALGRAAGRLGGRAARPLGRRAQWPRA